MELKQDKYRHRRGGLSRLLEISCVHCNQILCLYQKDGIGHLKRLYLDRISSPTFSLSGNMVCPQCQTVIGTPMIYSPEGRPAIHLRPGFFKKTLK